MMGFKKYFLRHSSALPCGTPWPSVCSVRKLPVCSGLLSDASPPPAARTVCTNMMVHIVYGTQGIAFSKAVRFRLDLEHVLLCRRNGQHLQRTGFKAGNTLVVPLGSLVHLGHFQLPLLWCAALHVIHTFQPGIAD